MKLAKGQCCCCGGNKVLINSKPELYEKLFINLFGEDKVQSPTNVKDRFMQLKWCPICFQKVLLLLEGAEQLHNLPSSQQNICVICKCDDNVVEINEWLHVSKILEEFGQDNDCSLCLKCLYYIDLRYGIKNKIYHKVPQLKRKRTKSDATSSTDSRKTRSRRSPPVIEISDDESSDTAVLSKGFVFRNLKPLSQFKHFGYISKIRNDPKFYRQVPYVKLQIYSMSANEIPNPKYVIDMNEDEKLKKNPFFKIKLKSHNNKYSIVKNRSNNVKPKQKLHRKSVSHHLEEEMDVCSSTTNPEPNVSSPRQSPDPPLKSKRKSVSFSTENDEICGLSSPIENRLKRKSVPFYPEDEARQETSSPVYMPKSALKSKTHLENPDTNFARDSPEPPRKIKRKSVSFVEGDEEIKPRNSSSFLESVFSPQKINRRFLSFYSEDEELKKHNISKSLSIKLETSLKKENFPNEVHDNNEKGDSLKEGDVLKVLKQDNNQIEVSSNTLESLEENEEVDTEGQPETSERLGEEIYANESPESETDVIPKKQKYKPKPRSKIKNQEIVSEVEIESKEEWSDEIHLINESEDSDMESQPKKPYKAKPLSRKKKDDQKNYETVEMTKQMPCSKDDSNESENRDVESSHKKPYKEDDQSNSEIFEKTEEKPSSEIENQDIVSKVDTETNVELSGEKHYISESDDSDEESTLRKASEAKPLSRKKEYDQRNSETIVNTEQNVCLKEDEMNVGEAPKKKTMKNKPGPLSRKKHREYIDMTESDKVVDVTKSKSVDELKQAVSDCDATMDKIIEPSKSNEIIDSVEKQLFELNTDAIPGSKSNEDTQESLEADCESLILVLSEDTSISEDVMNTENYSQIDERGKKVEEEIVEKETKDDEFTNEVVKEKIDEVHTETTNGNIHIEDKVAEQEDQYAEKGDEGSEKVGKDHEDVEGESLAKDEENVESGNNNEKRNRKNEQTGTTEKESEKMQDNPNDIVEICENESEYVKQQESVQDDDKLEHDSSNGDTCILTSKGNDDVEISENVFSPDKKKKKVTFSDQVVSGCPS